MRRSAHLLLLLILGSAPAAHAGGWGLPARGVRALSVGGAFVASAEGANALWYNPARLDETSLEAEVGLVTLDAAFTPSAGAQAGVRAESDGRELPNPTFGFTFKLNELLSLAAGAYAPYSGFARFAEDGPQRYSLIESDQTTLLYLHVGAALRFGRLRVGGGLQNVVAHIRQRHMLSGYSGIFGHPEDPTLDALEELELEDPVNLTGNLGASFDLGPVTLGLAVQLPYVISGEADFRVRLPSSVFFDPVVLEGDKVRVEIPVPMAIRGGAAWRIMPAVQVEAAFNWENWSVQDKIELVPVGALKLHDVPAVGDYALPTLAVDRRMRDTLSLHLGGDVEVLPGLHLRAGGYYEPSSFSDRTFSVALLDDDKLGVGLGASYLLGPVRLELAVSRVFQGTRQVSESELKQVNPTNPDQAIVVGNGTYESSLWAVGFGVSWLIGGQATDGPAELSLAAAPR